MITATSVNLAVALSHKGYKVLLVDMDPQGHATLGLGYNPDDLNESIYDVLIDEHVPINKVIIESYVSGLRLAPSNILLSGAETELAGYCGREHILRKRLENLGDSYDICIIDCSPSLGLLTLNALVSGTEVIIPVQAHYYALEGLKQLLETIDIVKDRYNRALKIRGVLLTFVESRTLLSKEVQSQMRDYFGELVFKTVIHRTIRLAEAPSAGQSVITYDARNRGALEYIALADEISNGQAEGWITQTNFYDI